MFACIAWSSVSAQQDGSDAAILPIKQLPKIGNPSPNAASLGTYANYPVGNFTGAPEISVPIYEIDEGGFKLPISLSYNASGIKVNDIASWVGLGWSLNAGGVITRNVIGAPDDVKNWTTIGGINLYPTQPPTSPSYGNFGFLYANYNGTVSEANARAQLNPGGFTIGHFFNSQANNIAWQFKLLRFYQIDAEPDIFNFNFNGHAGKFIFNQGTNPSDNTGSLAPDQHTAMLIPYQDLKITYSFN